MSDGRVHYGVSHGVATVRFDRPEARNAMTWAMYAELASACTAMAADASVRVAVFRGTSEAFVAGTDIGQFTTFQGADDGVAYERKVEAAIEQIEKLPMPTVAVVEGWCMGGGLVMATACDFRIATPQARFGGADRAHAGQLPFDGERGAADGGVWRPAHQTHVAAGGVGQR